MDDAYLQESMMLPNAKIVEGFEPIMPSFQGLLHPQDIRGLIAYIKTSETIRTADRRPTYCLASAQAEGLGTSTIGSLHGNTYIRAYRGPPSSHEKLSQRDQGIWSWMPRSITSASA